MRLFLVALLALVSFIGAALAQEEETSLRYEYVLDEQTELTLDSHVKDPKTWSMELRQYGPPEKGTVLTFSCELKRTADNVYEYKAEGDRTAKSVKVTGDVGSKASIDVATKNLVYEDNKPARIRGTFKRIDIAGRTARLKERWQKADSVLNDTVTRLLSEVGKNGEAKVREVQQERLKLRDARALAEAGGPEGDKEVPAYYLSMLSSTLEQIGFLKAYTGRTVQRGMPGSYRTAAGGTLELSMAEDGGLTFTMTVLHPGESFTGEMTGVARLAGTRAIYKEAIKKKDQVEGQEPAEVVFTQHGGHIIHVEAKNTETFTGPGVSYEGDYYKIAPKKEVR